MLDKKIIKEKLESERNALVSELGDLGQLNSDTGEWEATPEGADFHESDQNDMADRFEEYESKSSNIDVLELRLHTVEKALKNINKESFAHCKICKQEIEADRIEANPAALTCKKHLEE